MSLTDPDRRAVPKNPQVDVGHNAQGAVDEKHQLIVAQAVTNTVTDADQLSPIARQAKEALGADQLTGGAAMSDSHGEGIKACAEAGITPDVAKPLTSATSKWGLYGKETFTYDAARDGYRCPAGQEWTLRFDPVERGRPRRDSATPACRSCAIKAHCTRNTEGRRITRGVHEAILERMPERVEAKLTVMKSCKQSVEPPCSRSSTGMTRGIS